MKLLLLSAALLAASAHDDVMVGIGAGALLSTGSQNVCIGAHACPKLTTGSRNICIGDHSCPDLTTQNDQTDVRGMPEAAARSFWKVLMQSSPLCPSER